MKSKLALAALLALAACASPSGASGRTDWSCANGRAFSARTNAQGGAEVFAGGRVYSLPAAGGGFSDGAVTYDPSSATALTGAFGGPYENCRRG
jgi:transglutaminase-like putative cysteine protease